MRSERAILLEEKKTRSCKRRSSEKTALFTDKAVEDAWNSRDLEQAALAYASDSQWCNF
jgi:nuclear transport factor 2 (NTF2) superfamily protein